MAKLVSRLKDDYSDISFKSGDGFCWSPASRQVIYKSNPGEVRSDWALLHEVAHALLGHTKFSSDLSLLKAEVDAWVKASKLAPTYNLEIDQDYIEDCLDTYRDWLYRRSRCPNCQTACLQLNNSTKYLCHNCNLSWRVSRERFCRPYRMASKLQPTTPL